MTNEINWAWYLSRSSGLVGFFLLYLSILLGLSIRTPLLGRIIKPAYSYRSHCWISFQALFFSFVHGVVLLFDKYISFSWGNIFIPFYPQESAVVDPLILSLGIIAFYAMSALVVSSYLKKYISHSLWRAVHFLSVGLYFISIIHSLYLGTDLKSPGIARSIFLGANFFLAALFSFNLLYRLVLFFKKNENISESDAPVV